MKAIIYIYQKAGPSPIKDGKLYILLLAWVMGATDPQYSNHIGVGGGNRASARGRLGIGVAGRMTIQDMRSRVGLCEGGREGLP